MSHESHWQSKLPSPSPRFARFLHQTRLLCKLQPCGLLECKIQVNYEETKVNTRTITTTKTKVSCHSSTQYINMIAYKELLWNIQYFNSKVLKVYKLNPQLTYIFCNIHALRIYISALEVFATFNRMYPAHKEARRRSFKTMGHKPMTPPSSSPGHCGLLPAMALNSLTLPWQHRAAASPGLSEFHWWRLRFHHLISPITITQPWTTWDFFGASIGW